MSQSTNDGGVATDLVSLIGVRQMRAEVTLRVSRVPAWAALTFCAGAVALTWWLTSLSIYHGPDHLIGPFHIPLAFEWAVGGSAVGLAVLAAVVINKPHVGTTADAGLSPAAVAWLITASIVIAGCWRVVTSGGNGANIGGGLVCWLVPSPWPTSSNCLF